MNRYRRVFFQSLAELVEAGADGEAALAFCLDELRALQAEAERRTAPVVVWCPASRVWVLVVPGKGQTVIE
jgi:hypothetical protein